MYCDYIAIITESSNQVWSKFFFFVFHDLHFGMHMNMYILWLPHCCKSNWELPQQVLIFRLSHFFSTVISTFGNGLFYSMSPKYSTVLHSFLNEELFFIYGVLSDWQKMHVPPSTINQLLDFRNLPSDVLK